MVKDWMFLTLYLGKKQGGPLSSLLYSTRNSNRWNKARQRNKRYTDWKGRIKMFS
jgi:hypothetical protein